MSKHNKILIVEDDPASMMLLKGSAKKYFPEIIEAKNGKDGYDQFIKSKPDLIITDIGMPIMDGLEMSRLIKELKPDQDIIVTSAFDDKSFLLKAIEIGITNYIVKPVQIDAINSALETSLNFINLEKENKERKDRLEVLSKVMNASSSMIVIMGNDLSIQYVNPSFLEFTGYNSNDLLQRHVIEIFNDYEYNTEYLNFLNDPQASGDWKGDFGAVKNNGEKYFAHATISAIRNESGDLTNYIKIFDDVTEKFIEKEKLIESNDFLEEEVKRRTVELENALKKAEAVNEAKSLFLANISHELRTPLNGILGMISVLISKEEDAEQRRKLHIVESSGSSLLKLINDLIDYSQSQTENLKFIEEEFDLYSNILETLAILEPLAYRKGVKLSVDYASDMNRDFIGDNGRIKQIITNLVGNSIKFTENGEVTITVRSIQENKVSDKLSISVKDTGIGIPEDKLETLFDSFTQIDNKLNRKFGGTGLGLSITKDIVERMNGSIDVKSELGIGSEFIVTIELERSSELDPIDRDTNNTLINDILTEFSDLKANILIAEDSEINQVVMSEVLESLNLNVDTAEDGLIAYQLAKTKNYDIIFMDIQMPEMDGFEASEKIIAYKPYSVIIGLTAHIDPQNT